MSVSTQEKRLDRIEEKIDKLSEAMVMLARAEERLIAMETKYALESKKLDKVLERVDNVEMQLEKSARVYDGINKVFWLLLTSIIGAASAWFLKV